MSIPVNLLAAGAVAYSPDTTTVGVVSNVYPNEGEKVVPMAFGFATANIIEVDLNLALNSLSLSQLRGLYIDNTQSLNDVTLYFSQTGYQITVKAGYSNLVSLINFEYNYRFYIFLANQVYDSISVVNVFALNFMLPPFNTFNMFNGAIARHYIMTASNTFEYQTPLHLGVTYTGAGGNIKYDAAFNWTLQDYDFMFLLCGESSTFYSVPVYSVNFKMIDLNGGHLIKQWTFTNTTNNLSVAGSGRHDYRDLFIDNAQINYKGQGTNAGNTGFKIVGTTIAGVTGSGGSWGSFNYSCL